ncbi:glycosyltransferase family 25 protein [Acinetobacter faecalis]|uniref:glycosyltransferase family 25 protein n=1 Tax=Acinetobacter faecalis TaxID=2665161 RepID=UPI002A908B4A|nr:glycosyltransferase family 25 protein [Acinetobacter faecalis]MDY6484734.1 glycosyltransferase family 25 protein [Acinetobacter faecalis]MDY6510220.1 glycosyltransferase family 25 protein [Acinetobacter faecalis]MDY6536460.1 glycosyltransferase family 25 protein [Acinetobacter faecalis]
MKIYLVSLEGDYGRRNLLKENFTSYYKNFIYEPAVWGKSLKSSQYFKYSLSFYNKHKQLITPNEVGCTLSHLNVLKNFLTSNAEYALILEDDVVGYDEDIESVLKYFERKCDLKGLFILGGQDGLNYEKYILGREINQNIIQNNVYSIAKFSSKFIFRTCCYVVNRELAKYIIEYHKLNFSRADCWFDILKDTNFPLTYMNIFKHPVDLSNSHIEKERNFSAEPNFIKRILKQGLFWKIRNRILNDYNLYKLLILGYKQILKEREK